MDKLVLFNYFFYFYFFVEKKNKVLENVRIRSQDLRPASRTLKSKISSNGLRQKSCPKVVQSITENY